MKFILPVALLLAATSVAQAPPASAAESVTKGYARYEQFREQCEKLAEHELVSLDVLGTTAKGRDILVLTVGADEDDNKADSRPAILVMGAVSADQVAASSVALGMARRIALDAEKNDDEKNDNEGAARLLREVTFYFIPRPSPDATERVFAKLRGAKAVNTRKTDDDRDGTTNEDPGEDLNDDGVLTMMRVADPTGEWIAHPDDPRVMIKADRSKGEQGKYRLLSEGVDNDGDEAWNEDGPGGVDFNRNFTFNYPYFAGDAGPHQVSEVETRAVADFAYDHQNIYMVVSLAPQTNLTKAWAASGADAGPIKTSVRKDDVQYFEAFAKQYAEVIKPDGAPTSADDAGSFVPWAYYHFGRWSVSAPVWWIPKAEAKKEEKKPEEDKDGDKEEDKGEDKKDSVEAAVEETVKSAEDLVAAAQAAVDKIVSEAVNGDAKKEATASGGDEKADDKKPDAAKPDERGSDEIRALKWFAEVGRTGFVDWAKVDHPDFEGKEVEVGGFMPLAQTTPPADKLNELIKAHSKVLLAIAAKRPQLVLRDVKAESLGGGVYRIEVTASNDGALPTLSAMGQMSGQLTRLELALELPEGTKFLAGSPRTGLPVLTSHGGSTTRRWLVQLKSDDEATAKLTLAAPSMGHTTAEVQLEDK